jgi:hypothetical protein
MTDAVTTDYVFLFPEECVGIAYEVVDTFFATVVAIGFVPASPAAETLLAYNGNARLDLALVTTKTIELPWTSAQRYYARLVALPGTGGYIAEEMHPVGWTRP